MADLRLVHPSSSCSGALLPHFSLMGSDWIFGSRDHQQLSETYRSLCISSHKQRNFHGRAFLDDRRVPFTFQSGTSESHFMEEEEEEEEDLSVFNRLALAWRILFPKRKKIVSPAEIAKQRLKMILISDRCSVNDKAKRKIVDNIVGALADVVEIESQDCVRVNVSADPDLGTVYSVSVPVRRVKPEFRDTGNHLMYEEYTESQGGELGGSLDALALVPDEEVFAMEASSSPEKCGRLKDEKFTV